MRYFIFQSLFLLTSYISVSQPVNQSLTVTGRITSWGNEPVASVSVIIKKTTIGTLTDNNGNYQLKGVREGDSVIFTHIAYKRTALVIKGNTRIDVQLETQPYRMPVFTTRDTVIKKNVKRTERTATDYLRIFDKVEIIPYFPGGQSRLVKYLDSAVKYPAEAKEKQIEGEVLVGFVVGTGGEIKNVRIVRGVSKECDTVALEAIQHMPKWTPGIQNGRPVEVSVELPISFSLLKISEN